MRQALGTQTDSTFVARMLTVVTSLKFQRRNVLEFMTNAVGAARNGTPAPSLLRELVVQRSYLTSVGLLNRFGVSFSIGITVPEKENYAYISANTESAEIEALSTADYTKS